MRRVVITGIGVISPLGNSAEALWEGLVQGRSGVATLSLTPASEMPISIGGEARDFSAAIDDFGPLEGEKKKTIRKTLKVMCREALMGVAAGQRALADAGYSESVFSPERTGSIFGSDYMITAPDDFTAGIKACTNDEGVFQFTRWAGEGLPQLNPLWLLKYLPNMPAAHLAIYNDLRGPNNSLTVREASANVAFGEAFRIIARGAADAMISGSTGTRLHPMKAVHAVTQEEVIREGQPETASRPFDRNRQGMILGEGAGAMMLESLEHAQARGAKIYGEIIGFGSSTVASRAVANRRQALYLAMRGAMQDAKLSAEQLGHLHAHGLSTRTCDQDEAQAINELLGGRSVPVVAAKSCFGNLGAGSGAVEAIASLLALRQGTLFPVQNYQTPDPECPLSIVTQSSTPAGSSFLNTSVTPQGQASAVVIQAWN